MRPLLILEFDELKSLPAQTGPRQTGSDLVVAVIFFDEMIHLVCGLVTTGATDNLRRHACNGAAFRHG